MSQNYCIQSIIQFQALTMFTAIPINFPSLQFSLSVNSLVIFLFSKYPFNFGFANNFCINEDEFGFALIGQNFNIDLTNYQGYYMLIIIYPEGINLSNVGTCQIVPNLSMTFQNTTISPVQNMNILSNFDSQEKFGFCTCYQGQTIIPGAFCSNYSVYSMISLNNLNNYLVINTCQAFIIQNNTTIQFVTPFQCSMIGAYISAPIIFYANQEVIDFLNNNNILYSIISSNVCQISQYLSQCPSQNISVPVLPCKSIYQISQLLSPPLKYSLISSKLWNEIVQDLYLAYSIYKYIKYFSQFPYQQNIYHAILDFYNFYENFKPYIFTPLIHAKKGLPLTADYFNSLIDAIIELANFANIQLQKGISHVQPDQIIRSLQFDNIVYNVNQLLTFNFNQYFLLSCYGIEFINLLNSISTFLNVLINNLQFDIIIPNNVYIKNFLIYNNSQIINIYGTIVNFIMYFNQGTIKLQDNAYINSINIEINNGNIFLTGNTYVNTLYIKNNNNKIYLYDNSIIENLICKKTLGTIQISGNAMIINNQCI